MTRILDSLERSVMMSSVMPSASNCSPSCRRGYRTAGPRGRPLRKRCRGRRGGGLAVHRSRGSDVSDVPRCGSCVTSSATNAAPSHRLLVDRANRCQSLRFRPRICSTGFRGPLEIPRLAARCSSPAARGCWRVELSVYRGLDHELAGLRKSRRVRPAFPGAAATLTPSPKKISSPSKMMSPTLMPIRKSSRLSGAMPLLRSAMSRCTSTAQRTASTTLRVQQQAVTGRLDDAAVSAILGWN